MHASEAATLLLLVLWQAFDANKYNLWHNFSHAQTEYYHNWFDFFRAFLAPEHGEKSAFLLRSHIRRRNRPADSCFTVFRGIRWDSRSSYGVWLHSYGYPWFRIQAAISRLRIISYNSRTFQMCSSDAQQYNSEHKNCTTPHRKSLSDSFLSKWLPTPPPDG